MTDPELIIVELNKLSLHYPARQMSEREAALWMADYLEDLKSYPPELIRKACEIWRRGSERRFPTIGQLMDIVEPLARRAQDPEPPREWSPMNQVEFQTALPHQKVRELRILAHQERLKASRHGSPRRQSRAERGEGYRRHMQLAAELDRQADLIAGTGEKGDHREMAADFRRRWANEVRA